MKTIKLFFTGLLILASTSINAGNLNGNIDFRHDPANKKVDVLINNKLFTSYIYPDNMEKQVLYPIFTVSGQDITRGFPLNPRPFERTDHPHHVGLWFNFGDVNGLDFWNNSFAIKPEEKHKYGSIKFDRVASMNPSTGELRVVAHWVNSKGEPLLEERTTFIFSEKDNTRHIDRITELIAKQNEVVFTENKEGLLGLRVDRAFEEPSKNPGKFLDAQGNVTETPVLNNDGVNGVYRNAEGVSGGDVWGKKSKWVALSANKNGEIITIIMMDHPRNHNDPAWSHARGYGLFAMNNLAGRAVDENSPPVKITLQKEENIIFRHKLVIGGDLSDSQIDKICNSFGNSK